MGGDARTSEERERKLLLAVVIMVAALIMVVGTGLSCLLVMAVFPRWEQASQTEHWVGYALGAAGAAASLGLALRMWRVFKAFQKKREGAAKAGVGPARPGASRMG